MLTSANDYVRVILFFLYFFEIVKTRVYIYRSPGTYRESENRQILSNRSAIYRKFLLHPPSSFKAYPSSHVGFEITTLPETLQFLAASKLSNYLRCFSFRYRFDREGIIIRENTNKFIIVSKRSPTFDTFDLRSSISISSFIVDNRKGRLPSSNCIESDSERIRFLDFH